ncbi:MAG TPA: tripartite tricarboxylate transporter substrate binding protein [Burkholderiales bacterium]|nr:tripartite tricarboxylate transporter substrate binding protein [Burkholderiales bacterium]
MVTHAQTWKPDQAVEIIVNCAPGCGPDRMARLMHGVFQTHKFVEAAITVQNKTGGGGAVAQTYLNQFAGNGHYLFHTGKSVLTTHAMGRSAAPYTELTPVANLFGEYIGIAVKADSPIQSGRDLIERLKKDPTAVSFGIATSLGNTNHQGVAGALKAAGVDIKKSRNVVFQSGALAIVAMLGGHIDAVPVSVGSWVPHMKTGAVRVIAVSAAQRLPGFFSGIPTWREQGANAVVSNWRGVFGAKGMTPAQVAYWEAQFQKLVESPEWKAEMVTLNGLSEFMNAARLKKYMEEDYAEVKAFLVDLELAKK